MLAMLRKASRSRTKGQRLSSLVEDEAESVEVEAEPVEEVLSGTLLDLDILDCPVCCHALTNPIFQVIVSSYPTWSAFFLQLW